MNAHQAQEFLATWKGKVVEATRAGDLKEIVRLNSQKQIAKKKLSRRCTWPGCSSETHGKHCRTHRTEFLRTRSTNPELRPFIPGRLSRIQWAIRQEIVAALRETRGHKGQAASLLSIGYQALWSRMLEFDIRDYEFAPLVKSKKSIYTRLELAHRRELVWALTQTKGNKKAAARLLRIGLNGGIFYSIKRFGIQPGEYLPCAFIK